jgi:hypothetical protein
MYRDEQSTANGQAQASPGQFDEEQHFRVGCSQIAGPVLGRLPKVASRSPSARATSLPVRHADTSLDPTPPIALCSLSQLRPRTDISINSCPPHLPSQARRPHLSRRLSSGRERLSDVFPTCADLTLPDQPNTLLNPAPDC